MHTVYKAPVKLLSLAFFISGGSALIFETVWFYSASLTLGSSVWSAAAVLVAFMGGLAIGNALIAFKGQNIRDPLKAYVSVEVAIGISGVLAVLALPLLTPVIASVAQGHLDNTVFLTSIRFAVALLILVIPTVAMGITLPILQNGLRRYQWSFFSSLGMLYGWNTVGAVFGTLIAEIILIKIFGILSTALIACILNFLAAYIVYRVFVRYKVDHSPVDSIDSQKPLHTSLGSKLAYLVPPFIAGFVLLALEIIWFRHMTLLQAGTSRVFSIMLACVLLGIGLGGLIASNLKIARRNLVGLIVILSAVAGLTVLFSFFLYQQYLLHFTDRLIISTWWFTSAALIFVAPTCVLSGMLFPLFGELIYEKNNNTSFSSGTVILANTLGGAIGSCTATFFLLPRLGIEKSILILALSYLVISLYISVLLLKRDKKFSKFAVPALGILAIVTLFPSGTVLKSYEFLGSKRLSGDWELVTIREGLNETIQYYRKSYFGIPSIHRMLTNSFSMAGTGFPGKRYMKLFAYFPYVFNQNIQSVLQVSYGVGNTAEAITSLKSVKRYDIVDISKDVLDLSKIAHSVSGVFPLKDSRTNVHIEDGRFYLLSTKQKYDLITGEPPPPKIANVVNLYTQEYFSLIYDRLNEGGVVTYWLPVHQLQPMDTLAIVKAFCRAFKDCSLWGSMGLEFMLVGTRGGMPQLTKNKLDELWNTPFAAELKNIGIEKPGQIGSMYLADSAALNRLTKLVKPLTDNYPRRISSEIYNHSLFTPLYSHLLDINRRKTDFVKSEFVASLFSKDVIEETLFYFHHENAFLSFMLSPYGGEKIYYWDYLAQLLKDTQLSVAPLLYIGSSLAEQKASAKAGNRFESDPNYILAKAKGELVKRNYQKSSQLFWRYLAQFSTGKNYRDFAFKLYLVAVAMQGNLRMDDLEKGSDLGLDPLDKQFKDWLKGKWLIT